MQHISSTSCPPTISSCRGRFPDRFIDVRYEDLVQNTETTVRDLLDRLDLSWQDACIRYFENSSGVTTASAAQVREAPHTRSIGRWRHYAEMLQPMLQVLQHGSGY